MPYVVQLVQCAIELFLVFEVKYRKPEFRYTLERNETVPDHITGEMLHPLLLPRPHQSSDAYITSYIFVNFCNVLLTCRTI